MKRRIICSIVAGLIAVTTLSGCGLSKARSASEEVKPHNQSVEYIGEEINVALNGKAADYEDYAEPEAVAAEGGYENNSSSINVDPSKGRLLIREVTISAETKNYDAVVAELKSKVEAAGGYIEYSSVRGTGKDRNLRTGSFVYRVPADKLDAIISAVGDSCTVTSSSEGTTDVTLEYVDTKSRLESLRVEYEQLLNLLEQADDLDSIIVLQSRLTEVRTEIEQSESRIRTLENQVVFATLSLTVSEVLEEKEIVEPHVVTFGEKIADAFADMKENTVDFFQGLVLFIIEFIPGLIFIGINVAIILIIVFTARKKRRQRRAEALAKKEAEEKKSEEKKSEEKPSEDGKKEENKG